MLLGVPPADETQKGHRCRSPHPGNRLVLTPRRNSLPGGIVCRSRSITPVGRPVSCPRLRREQWPTRTIRYRVGRSRLAWTRNSGHEQREAAFQHMLEPFVHREGTVALRYLSSREGGARMRSVAHTAFPRVPRGVLGVRQCAWQLPAAAYPEVRLRSRGCLSSIREASSADNPHQILLRMQCRSFGTLPLFRVPAHFPDRLVASNISVSCRGCTTNRKRNISLGGSATYTVTHPGMNAVTSSGALHHLRLTLRPGIRLTSCSPETQSRQGTVPESTIHRVGVCENPVKPSFPQNVHRIFTILH